MSIYETDNDVLIVLSRGKELVIKEKYLKKFKRYRDGEPFYGVYNDEDSEEPYEIWIEKSMSPKEKVITQIHEIMHFVHDVGNDLEDPGDLDTLAQYIYTICQRATKAAERGEAK